MVPESLVPRAGLVPKASGIAHAYTERGRGLHDSGLVDDILYIEMLILPGYFHYAALFPDS